MKEGQGESEKKRCPRVMLRCLYPQSSVGFVLDIVLCTFGVGSESKGEGEGSLFSETVLRRLALRVGVSNTWRRTERFFLFFSLLFS